MVSTDPFAALIEQAKKKKNDETIAKDAQKQADPKASPGAPNLPQSPSPAPGTSSSSGDEPRSRLSFETIAAPKVTAPMVEPNAQIDAILARVKSAVTREEKEPGKTVVEKYGATTIYRVEGDPLLLYSVPTPRTSDAELSIIKTIKEAATRLISISPYRIRDLEQRRTVYKQKILEILQSAPEIKVPNHLHGLYADAVVREMVGYGAIDPLVADDRLEEIMINGPQALVYVFHRKYEMMKTNIVFASDADIQDLINRIAREVGRRVDISSPLLDARLPDGSRVNATIPPASVDGSSLTIRKFRQDPYTIVDLVKNNTLSSEAGAFLWLCVDGLYSKPANILIAGGTGGGKTSLLNVLASMVPEHERVISIEDTHELSLPLAHWIKLEARPPGLEGKGELSLDILTKNALRMRPDRIIVGEVRHDEAFTLFTAMNTGHAGSMGTLHANSAAETLVRITSPPMNVPEVMIAGLDILIMIQRIHDRTKGTVRRVTQIAEIGGTLDRHAQTQTLFERDAVDDTLERTAIPSLFVKKLENYTGYSAKEIQFELEDRAKLLEELASADIRRNDDVHRAFNAYRLQKKGLHGR